jgi:hypothetical protein
LDSEIDSLEESIENIIAGAGAGVEPMIDPEVQAEIGSLKETGETDKEDEPEMNIETMTAGEQEEPLDKVGETDIGAEVEDEEESIDEYTEEKDTKDEEIIGHIEGDEEPNESELGEDD